MQAIATSLPVSVEQDKSVSQGEEENKTDKPVLTQLSPVQYFLEVSVFYELYNSKIPFVRICRKIPASYKSRMSL